MAGRAAATLIVLAALCSVLATAPAYAESVPLPTPAPLPKSGAAPAPPVNAAPAEPAPTRGFFPFSNFGILSPQANAFDARQRALLDRISLYLSSVQTMVGNFVQIGPDGGRTEGNFYIQKPGKVRFQYKPPTTTDIVADGSYVAVRDRRLATQDTYLLSQTPLRYLLAERIDLMHDTDVVSVTADDTFATVVIEEKQLAIGTSRLMMMFDAKTLELKQWTVTDPQGFDTTVAVYNLDTAKRPDPDLFVIGYQRDQGGISNQ
jgi:outer membrane lipoprotein-sorting protein